MLNTGGITYEKRQPRFGCFVHIVGYRHHRRLVNIPDRRELRHRRCAAILLYRTWKLTPEKNTPIDLFSSGPKRAYISMAILVVYVFLLEPLGFIIATTLLEFIFIRWFSKKGYVVSFLISAAVTAVVFGIFQFVLNVPVGSFGLIKM